MEEIARRIYDILVKHAGASDDEVSRMQFLSFMESGGREFRFGGHLGFGGKFWYPGCYVTCYREDFNPRTNLIIQATNTMLKEIK